MSEETQDLNFRFAFDTMLHFLNGGEVVSRPKSFEATEEYLLDLHPTWDWSRYDYKPVIKEEKTSKPIPDAKLNIALDALKKIADPWKIREEILIKDDVAIIFQMAGLARKAIEEIQNEHS
jgi:hypothetical protein